jgi:hypothetical protein
LQQSNLNPVSAGFLFATLTAYSISEYSSVSRGIFTAYLQSFDGKLYLLNIGFPDYKKPMPLSESLFFNQSFRVIATPEDAIIK